MERQFDKASGVMLPFSPQEHHDARVEYMQADTPEKRTAVLVKYPFLAGRDWEKYVPKPAAPIAEAVAAQPELLKTEVVAAPVEQTAAADQTK